MAWKYAENEAKRKDFAVYWVTDGQSDAISKTNLEIIGKGIEDMPVSMNPQTEETQDILGNNNFAVTGYAETMTVDPLNVRGESTYSQHIDELMERRATLDELENYYLCIKRYKTNEAGEMRAWVQKGIVELGDFASGLEGVSATHTVRFVGERVLGAVDPATMTFTPDETTGTAETDSGLTD